MAWKRKPSVRLRLLLVLELADRQDQAVTSTTMVRGTLTGAEQAGRTGPGRGGSVTLRMKQARWLSAACSRPRSRLIFRGGTGSLWPRPAMLIHGVDVMGATAASRQSLSARGSHPRARGRVAAVRPSA